MADAFVTLSEALFQLHQEEVPTTYNQYAANPLTGQVRAAFRKA